ncbi:MAG TPA: hypothetical protein VK988_08255 [Acidimicrobiales bacterium]|nr:hypothetical protein [Acidimicrobiales bacterium]
MASSSSGLRSQSPRCPKLTLQNFLGEFLAAVEVVLGGQQGDAEPGVALALDLGRRWFLPLF